MERAIEALMGFGLVIMAFGAMAADSANIMWPLVIILSGMAVMGLAFGLAYLTGYQE